MLFFRRNSFRSPANVCRRLKILPRAIQRVSSWPRFVFNYAIGFKPRKAYRFRIGARLRLGRALDHAALLEIFLWDEYGPIRDGSVIVDVGANIGGFSIYATSAARNVQVYAYEPWPPYFDLLRENVALNEQAGSVRCYNLAVAATNANRPLYVDGPGLFFPTFMPKFERASGAAHTVACTTIDEILAANCLTKADLLKLDCEGAEYQILLTMTAETLQKFKEIRLEYHDLGSGQPSLKQLVAHLNSSGFEVTHDKRISANTGMLWAQQR